MWQIAIFVEISLSRDAKHFAGGSLLYCGEECQAQDWAAGHKLRCASQPRYRPVTPDASADPLDALAADVLAVLDDDLDDVDDI